MCSCHAYVCMYVLHKYLVLKVGRGTTRKFGLYLWKPKSVHEKGRKEIMEAGFSSCFHIC